MSADRIRTGKYDSDNVKAGSTLLQEANRLEIGVVDSTDVRPKAKKGYPKHIRAQKPHTR